MTKKILAILLAMMMILSVVACRGGSEPGPTSPPATEPGATEPGATEPGATEPEATDPVADDYKIAIYTGTVSQGEEEYQAAQKMIAKYGADKIVHATYPDNFSSEVEQVIQGVLQLASDPAVIADKADISMLVDELSMGVTIPTEAARMGATRLLHYSFPRHLGYETISARRQIMIDTCEELGIEFMDVEAPDPTGDSGMSGAQQFIVEDVPKKLEEYGPDTAFFSTNCGLQEPLIREVLKGGGIYPQQCCPSPYHAYPAALNIDVTGHEGDVKFMLSAIQEKLLDAGQENRMSTWGVPANMLMLEAGVEYSIEFIEGVFTDRNDRAALERAIAKVSADYQAGEITLSNYVTEDDTELGNFYLILAPFVDFSQPIQ